jgi:two-component system OmpR family sensor kinase
VSYSPPEISGVIDETLPPLAPDSATSGPDQAWLPPAAAPMTTAAPLPPHRRRWYHRLFPKTLTARLVTGVVALVIVVATAIGASTYFLLRAYLYDRLDRQLTSAASQNADSIGQQLLNGQGQAMLVNSGSPIWLTMLNSDTSVRAVSGRGFHLLLLSDDQRQFFVAHPYTVMTVTSGGSALRAESAPLPTGALLVMAFSTSEVERTLNRLLALEIAVSITAVAASALITTLGVRASLRPLHRVTRTAQEVTAELGPDGAGLDRRVPDADPETEVGQVAMSVNILLGAVQTEFGARLRSEERMRQFLADASHELRTPLTSIRGYAELSRLQGLSSNSPDDPMRRIEVEGTRMSRLVEDLLVLARGDEASDASMFEPVELDPLLSDAVRSVQAAHPERRFELGPPVHTMVVADRDQLLRLLLNLLNNAATHTSPPGPVVLRARRDSTPHGPLVTMQVVDAGPGLPPEEARHVFERFWRADKARSRARGGSGLGMAIVAQIAEAHCATVRFDSSVERGTTVSVTMPVLHPEPPTDADY